MQIGVEVGGKKREAIQFVVEALKEGEMRIEPHVVREDVGRGASQPDTFDQGHVNVARLWKGRRIIPVIIHSSK